MHVRAPHGAVAAIALLLSLSACASTTAEPPSTAPASPPAQSTEAPAEGDAPAESDPLAGWQSIETADGRFRWRIPADWSIVDESFEAKDDLGHVNAITVVSDRGQELAYFGSAFYGDRGGACHDWDGDGTTMVPARVHFDDPTVLDGEGRVVAYTSERAPGSFDFYAGYTLDQIEPDRVPCLRYSDVPVSEDRLQVSFGTTWDPALWEVPSIEEGEAYAETEEFDELIAMFRSLEVR